MPEKAAPPKWPPVFDPIPWSGSHWPPHWPPIWPPHWPELPVKPIKFPMPDPIPFLEKVWEQLPLQDLISIREAYLELQFDVAKAQFEAEKRFLEKQKEIVSRTIKKK